MDLALRMSFVSALTSLNLADNNLKAEGAKHIAEAIKMACSNPAEMFSLNHLGEILPNKRADLILFSKEANKIDIYKTFVNGKLVYSKK